LETTFNEINDELKKSWIDRAIDFIETVGRTIFQLAELLFSILTRVYHLVWDIIKHPIRFFETLVSGLKQGIGMFVGNIGTYMQEAFWTWITGTTPVKNIRLSAASGPESLFDLVMQVLSLGPVELRAIVEKVLGKEFMEMVDKGMEIGEKALEPVTILLTKGPLEFWVYIKETLSETIQSSFDRIRESVFNAFIEKSLKWIAGFFIPGGGFVKIVKAIFKAFQFVAENLENIRHFFDSIFDSMEAAVQGSTEGVVSKIITGLKTGVVLALDFLAKQLGLDKIVDSVQKIIQSLRRPIVNAIEWILKKVKPLALKLTSLVQKGVDWTKEKVERGKELAKEKIEAGKEKLKGWLGFKKGFKDDKGESHSIYFKGSENNIQFMVASTEMPVRKKLIEIRPQITDPLRTAYNDAKELTSDIERLIKATQKPDGGYDPADVDRINKLLHQLSMIMQTLMPLSVPEGKIKSDNRVKVDEVFNVENRIGKILEIEDKQTYALVRFKLLKTRTKRTGHIEARSMDWFVDQLNKNLIWTVEEKSKRELYMGSTPGKNTDVGEKVKKRMQGMGRYDPETKMFYNVRDKKWYPESEAAMGHIIDAVIWWNSNGRFTEMQSDEVIQFMQDPDNYELEETRQNSARGAALNIRYLPPVE
jgi:hypothetical protein